MLIEPSICMFVLAIPLCALRGVAAVVSWYFAYKYTHSFATHMVEFSRHKSKTSCIMLEIHPRPHMHVKAHLTKTAEIFRSPLFPNHHTPGNGVCSAG